MSKPLYIYILAIAAAINPVLSHKSTRRPNTNEFLRYSKTYNERCSDDQFRCKNNECIPFDTVCDGTVDCNDRSDETHALCRKTRCPRYSFRCSYGACLDYDAKCNGVQDCADNSDELHRDCLPDKQPNRCFNDDYQCDNGECISNDKVCDGTQDCSDLSDETISQCSEFHCPTYAFRCAYGGCVDGEARCNDVADCADWSDESEDMCEYYEKPISTIALHSCIVPQGPDRLFNKLGFKIKLAAGSRVRQHEQIEYVCDSGERIFSVCEKGQWTRPLVCPRSCNGIEDASDVDLVCRLVSGRAVDCSRKMPNNSTISATCSRGRNQRAFVVTCVDGAWSDELPTCDKKKVMLHVVYDGGLTITITDADNMPSHSSVANVTVINKSSEKYVLYDKTRKYDTENEVANYERSG